MRSKLTRAATLALAVCALSAVAAASASAALPEFKPSNGKFPALFSYSGTASFQANDGGVEIACESMYGEGEIKNAKEVSAQMYLKNCLSNEGRLYCWNEMSGSNYIISTKPLEGIIGYYEENGIRGVGLEFNAVWTAKVHPPTIQFAKFQCTGQKEVTLHGEIIGKLTPVNETLEKFTLSYATSEGVQRPHDLSDGFMFGESPEELQWDYGSEYTPWLLTSTQYFDTSPAVEIEA